MHINNGNGLHYTNSSPTGLGVGAITAKGILGSDNWVRFFFFLESYIMRQAFDMYLKELYL